MAKATPQTTTQRVKQITTASLDGGGTMEPAKLPATEGVPTDGLIISPEWMAQAIVVGDKTIIVKTRPIRNLANSTMLLLSGRRAIGVIQLGEMATFGVDEFRRLESRHLISDGTRRQWAKQYKGWGEGPFFAWPVVAASAFPEPRETNMSGGEQTIARDVVLKWHGREVYADVAKIRNVDDYDPTGVSDQVLRDDFRIVLAWWAQANANPEFKHSKATIKLLLRKILKEAVRRGGDVITFEPGGMAPRVRAFFLRVAREVKVPETQIRKAELHPEMDVKAAATQELLAIHWDLHLAHRRKTAEPSQLDLSIEDIVNLHALVVDELFSRDVKHPAPPDDGLDDTSADFERHAGKQQPDWYTPPARKVLKADYATINRSGVKRGPKITLDDVLPHFKTFKIRKPYVYLVGGLANHGETEGDIDILVKDTDGMPDEFKHVIHFRLGRALPPELAERLQIHYDNFHGPFTNFVELYDLTFDSCTHEIKEMSASEQHGIDTGQSCLSQVDWSYLFEDCHE